MKANPYEAFPKETSVILSIPCALGGEFLPPGKRLPPTYVHALSPHRRERGHVKILAHHTMLARE